MGNTINTLLNPFYNIYPTLPNHGATFWLAIPRNLAGMFLHDSVYVVKLCILIRPHHHPVKRCNLRKRAERG